MPSSLASCVLALATLIAAGCPAGAVRYPPVAAPCSARRVGKVTVAGAPREAVPQLTVLEGTLDDPDRAERVGQLAIAALRTRGWARATLAIARRFGCGVELDVAVQLGPAYRLAAITFATRDAFPPGERLAVIEDALGQVNTIGGIYVEYRLVRALAELERRYRDAGWLEAAIGAPRARYGRAGQVDLVIPIDAGRRYRIGSVSAIAPGGRAQRAVLTVLGLHAGEYYDGPRVRSAIARASARLARRVELRASIDEAQPLVDLEAIVEAAP